MNGRSDTKFRGWRSIAVALLVAVQVAAACSSDQDPTGGETHFLRLCKPGADCGQGLACLCGVCTRSCAGASDCAALARGECTAPSVSGVCAQAAPQTFCDALCTDDADCAAISADHRCEDGRCRSGSAAPNAGGTGGSGAAGASGAAGNGGDGGGGTGGCTSSEVNANQVVILGDSFFGATHQITAYLEDLARGAGALDVGERYRDYSALLNNALALGGNGIAAQYAAAAAEARVEVVIMNGGGTDVLAGACATPSSDCPVIVEASLAAEALLAQMAADGVAHVVYAFYPDPVDPNLRAKVDALRPQIEAVCQASPVACHFVDLRSTFADFYTEYIQPDGINPTAAGSQAAAGAIWETMQTNCIAQ